jgi:LysR family transcriptional regulator, transcriptional activator for dmlA
LKTKPKTSAIQPADLGFFAALARAGSLGAAARELGITTPAVSKHLALMESRLGISLVNRTTRRMSLTPEGELYAQHARRILGEIDGMQDLLSTAKEVPKGLLRVNATLGFGRTHLAPLISRFARKYPQVEVQLTLTVDPPTLSEDAYDVGVRFGAPPDSRLIARHIAPNRRLLCAAPSYLSQRGTPKLPGELTHHNCIGIRQGDDGYGVWRLTRSKGKETSNHTIKVRGNLTTNDGEIAVRWALDGHGIVMRAQWDVRHHLASGKLVQVLPQYFTPDADIYAVYPQRHQLAARVRVFVEFISASLTASAAPLNSPAAPQNSPAAPQNSPAAQAKAPARS